MTDEEKGGTYNNLFQMYWHVIWSNNFQDLYNYHPQILLDVLAATMFAVVHLYPEKADDLSAWAQEMLSFWKEHPERFQPNIDLDQTEFTWITRVKD